MAILIAELVGFVVILAVLYRYVLPLVTSTVAKRQAVIQQQVDDADEAARRYEAAQQRFESVVDEARVEAARIRDDARADATRIREELTLAAEQEIERIKQRGVEQLAAGRDQVVRELRAQLGGMSMQLAEQIVVESLADDTRRSRSVDHVLDGIELLPTASAGEIGRQATPAGGGTT